jgi:type III secretory pathway component EscU
MKLTAFTIVFAILGTLLIIASMVALLDYLQHREKIKKIPFMSHDEIYQELLSSKYFNPYFYELQAELKRRENDAKPTK